MNQQVDIPCGRILERDFLQHVKPKVYYEAWTVRLNGETCKMVGNADQVEARKQMRGKFNKLPPRRECIVKIPVMSESPPVGIINKSEI